MDASATATMALDSGTSAVERPGERAQVERLRAGDVGAFEEVYRAYRARLYGFLLRLTRRHEIAVELLQETWLRLAAEAPDLKPDTRLDAWLFTVARNLQRSHARWSFLDGSRLEELLLWRKDLREQHTPEAAAESDQARRRLEAALGGLPVKYREAVLLVAVEHFEPAEAARVVGVSAEAFRQRLSRGRQLLREKLGEGER